MGIAAKLTADLEAKSGDNGIKVNPAPIKINPDLKARFFGVNVGKTAMLLPPVIALPIWLTRLGVYKPERTASDD